MVKNGISVLMLLAVLIGCAAFNYRYYGLGQVVYEHGMLLGPKPKDDLPFSQCAPNATTQHPCVVLFTKDFFAFKQDYEDLQIRLSDCEKAKKSGN